ncbi:hypothetical protein Acsp06_45410 [Actinomycetospora sp. NBRC 106375]|uniref:helix-turn-helix domain-containing protein n=1 Tax=Actinomycetospora sp. NBRC 106375 TaxID=3032207 RepID=UPI0024A08DBC|nr:helix-turn-helix domain-containing protein [Actinomycetospora sp. NBRC 106375]GLZ48356.1 hypothetical protein Acsp06_45410 [Actinomycetospora sp. NBRC 106375]
MTAPPDPVDVATGVLMERYHQDLDAASTMLRKLAENSGRDVAEFAGGLLSDAPEGTAGAEPSVVARAVAFIHANAHRPIGIADIAGAAQIGVRGLQHAFRRHRHQTPMSYLRQVRMEGAHRDLVTGDPARRDTVGAIAVRWGFKSPGRFAVEYRQIHGTSPGEALRGHEAAPDDRSAVLARVDEARRRAELLTDLASEATTQALLARNGARSVALSPSTEARLYLMLGASGAAAEDTAPVPD